MKASEAAALPPEERPEWYRPPVPAFAPGHTVSMKHGVWSPRRVDPLAREILEGVSVSVSWWQPADMPAAWSWARAEARCQLLEEYLADLGGDAGGMLDGEGEVRSAAALLVRFEVQAANLRARLGLDPLSRARLGKDTASMQVDLARLFAELGAEDDEDEGVAGDG